MNEPTYEQLQAQIAALQLENKRLQEWNERMEAKLTEHYAVLRAFHDLMQSIPGKYAPTFDEHTHTVKYRGR